MATRDSKPLRLGSDVYNRVQRALADVIQLGWAGLGIDSTSTPSRTSVVDEALVLLEERIAKAKKGRR